MESCFPYPLNDIRFCDDNIFLRFMSFVFLGGGLVCLVSWLGFDCLLKSYRFSLKSKFSFVDFLFICY